MDLCPDCQKKKAVIKCTSTGNVRRCGDCDRKKAKELGIKPREIGCAKVEVFEPYTMIHGEMEKLEGTRFGDKVDVYNNKIHIENRQMKKEVQKLLEQRDAEKGEKIQGHTYGEGGYRPKSKIYSFIKG